MTDTGGQHVLLFEGRDAAGKGGTIKRYMEHLTPVRPVRGARKPSDREQGQWYFQRYVQHLPTEGEMVLFDRSWYNRAGVERVMGFAEDTAYERFMAEAPLFERMLVDSGIALTKFSFSGTQTRSRGHGSSSDRSTWGAAVQASPIDLESLRQRALPPSPADDDPAKGHRDGRAWTTIRARSIVQRGIDAGRLTTQARSMGPGGPSPRGPSGWF